MIYYQCKFRQAAPLRIGAGGSEDSDSDVMTDMRGVPFIPGSGIAGVLRTRLSREAADWLFGPVWGGTEENAVRESRVLVSDAVLPHGVKSGAFRIVTRDGVGINDRGTALQGAKYDFEVVECTEPYTAVIELPDRPEKHVSQGSDADMLERALREIVRYGVSFGARTSRGYGRMTAEIRRRQFDFPQDLDAWLKFDPMSAENFGGSPLEESADADADTLRIEATLQMEGSFSVRRYLSQLPKPDDDKTASSVPVYGSMTNQRNRPVIPGTSWAGVFRHHMRALIQEAGREELLEELDEFFGVVEQKEKETVKLKSRIRFGETEIRETDKRKRGEYVVTRVAVERFTGAPRNQGLFSSLVAWGGEGELLIELPAATSPDLRRLLAAALNDLHMGLLTAGGESSIGRGLCRIARLTVNGRDVTEQANACDTGYVSVSES